MMKTWDAEQMADFLCKICESAEQGVLEKFAEQGINAEWYTTPHEQKLRIMDWLTNVYVDEQLVNNP